MQYEVATTLPKMYGGQKMTKEKNTQQISSSGKNEH